MSDNPLDLAFASAQLQLESEQEPARQQFDALVRIVEGSQTPNELLFGYSVGERQIAFARDQYLISARLIPQGISVSISSPEGTSYAQSMLAALSAIYPTAQTAEVAAEQIGSLMARVIEGRVNL